MPRIPHRVYPTILILAAMSMVILACGAGVATVTIHGTVGTVGQSKGTATSATCATHPTTTAMAWDAGQQVVGNIAGAPDATLSNFVYPLGLPDETTFGQALPASIAWAPDGRHLAVSINVVVPFAVYSYPFVVDTASHAVSRVTLPEYPKTAATDDWERERLLTWADNNTLVVLSGFDGAANPAAGAYKYDISTHAATALPGVTHAADGVVRCSTLYYLELTPESNIGSGYMRGTGLLHRYDLATHSEVGSPVTLGDTASFGGAEGAVMGMGWDVSPDQSYIVYQHTTFAVPTTPSSTGLTSQFMAAKPDGSAAVHILPRAGSNSTARVAVSPDGHQVVVTDANPAPNVATGPILGGSDRYYSPDACAQPAWLPDSSGFDATSCDASSSGGLGTNIVRYLLSTPLGALGRSPGTLAHPNAGYPATLA